MVTTALTLLFGVVIGLACSLWLLYWLFNSEPKAKRGWMDDMINGERSKRA